MPTDTAGFMVPCVSQNPAFAEVTNCSCTLTFNFNQIHIKMTAVAKRNTGLNSKRGRQLALETKINEIDARLKELGVSELKYRIAASVSSPETNQNTVNISGATDINWLYRTLAYFKNIQQQAKLFSKDAKISTPVLLNSQGLPIHEIVHDLELRIVYVTNQVEINRLLAIKAELTPFMNEESRFITALKKVDSLLKS